MEELVTSAVTDLFSTMLSMKMLAVPMEPGGVNGDTYVAGSVGFIGRLSGVIYIYTTLGFARHITATLLGMEQAEVKEDELINDAMGEMANMLVGQMKSRLSDRGMPCVLTIPSVVRGSHFSIEAISTTEGHIFSYEASGHRIFVEFLVRPGEQPHNN